MKNRPLFYVFAGVVLGEGLFCINKIMAGAVAAFCLLILWKVSSCFFARKKSICRRKYFSCLVLGFFLGIFFLLCEEQNDIFEKEMKGTITGVVQEVGLGKTEQMKVSALCVNGKKIDGSALLYGPTKQILPGCHIRVHTVITPYEEPGNPGQFDLKSYYRCRKIYYSGFFEKAEVIKKSSAKMRCILYRFKSRGIKTCTTYLSEEDAGVLCAVLLGEKSFLDENLKDAYQKNGVAHILAISGLHISLIGSTLYRFFRKLGLPFLLSGILSFSIMIPYCIMIGSAVAAVRAVLMFSLFLGADIKGRTYDFLTSASLAGIFLLMESPYYLWDSSFLLSFGAIFGIGCIYPCFRDYRFGKTLWLGCSVWLTLLPIQLYFFYEISPFSIFLNFLVIPLMPPLVVFGFLGLLTQCFVCFLFCHIILSFYQWILIFPSYIAGKPDLPYLIFYILLLIGFCICIRKKRIFFACMCITIGISILVFPAPHRFAITFLDVGQGDCIVIHTKQGHHYMIDGGSSSVSKVGKYRILPYLKSKGIRKLDYVIITHFDEDHYNGILEILESGYEVKHLIVYKNANREDPGFIHVQKQASMHHIPILYFAKNDEIKDGELSMRCLFPPENHLAEENGQSLVFLFQYRGLSGLLTGDLEKEWEGELSRQMLPKVQLLKAGHHGSKTASLDPLLSKINPAYAIISCGKKNRYGHPHRETIERFKKRKIGILQTSECGAIRIEEVQNKQYFSCYKN